jgi:hypothetical protein
MLTLSSSVEHLQHTWLIINDPLLPVAILDRLQSKASTRIIDHQTAQQEAATEYGKEGRQRVSIPVGTTDGRALRPLITEARPPGAKRNIRDHKTVDYRAEPRVVSREVLTVKR